MKKKTKTNHIYTSDALHILAKLPESTIDAIVTDPPHSISFLGLDRDKGVPENLSVLLIADPKSGIIGDKKAR